MQYNEDEQDNSFFENIENEEEEQYISEEEYEELVARANHFQEAQLELAEQELKQRLLSDAVAMSKNSWFWPFKSHKSRLQTIVQTYNIFQKLTNCRK